MKFKKYITGILITGILINTFCMSSNAGTLSPDTRYEIFESNFIKIDDILEEDKVEVEVEGNTIVNYMDYSKTNPRNGTVLNKSTKEVYFTNATLNDSKTYTDVELNCFLSLEANKTYTLIFNILENTTSGKQAFCVVDGYGDYVPKESVNLPVGTMGLVKEAFTVKKDNNGIFKIYLRNHKDQAVRGTVKIKDIMILEGDWTNKDTPKYFEGLKSVGELENNTLEIKSQNKNLVDLNTFKNTTVHNGSLSLVNDGIKITTNQTINDTVDGYMEVGINSSPGTIKELYLHNLIKAKGNKTYTLSYEVEKESVNNHDVYVEFRDGAYNSLGYTPIVQVSNALSNTRTFTTPENTEYFSFRFDNNLGGNSLIFKNIQIEESLKKTDYVSNANSTKTFSLNQPLRSLPNGTKDKIVKKNGKWYIERNCGEIVFNGSENWQVHGNLTSDNIAFFVLVNNHKNNVKLNQKTINILNDKLPNLSRTGYDLMKNSEGISLHSNEGTTSWYSIGILKSKLTAQSVDSFKQWLSGNPIKLVYLLDTPTYELIDSSILNIYEQTTYISNNSMVPANMKVTVDRILNRALDSSDKAIVSESINDISTARAWVNMMRESIRKDELQEKLNNIFNINDLPIIEKKYATSNADVYIKAMNTLTMTLSTNHITFEDFSGTEDLEMINALNITVSSSLPYELNASLPVEIYNADKTEFLPKNILNIKENTDSSYKAFSTLGDKVILKDNNPPGNNIKHNIDLKLRGGITHKKDVYKTTIKFEVKQL